MKLIANKTTGYRIVIPEDANEPLRYEAARGL